MTERKFTFTDERLRKLGPEGKRTRLYDTKQPGLALRVTALGNKTFKFVAWDSTRGRSVEITIGAYPKVSLADARSLAQDLASRMAMGEDIVGQSQAERAEPTLDEAFDRWVAKKAQRGRTSWSMDRLRYDKHIKPRFGNRKVRDITTKQLEDWFLGLPKATGLSTTSANRCLVIIRTVFNQELRSYSNPCDGIALNREESRERFLRPAELPAFFTALESEQTSVHLRDYTYLALYTGARKANLLAMRWVDIDFDLGQWIIPAANSKNRTTMVLPLIPAVVEILERRWAENQERQQPSIYVFPAINPNSKTGHMTDVRDAWATLLKRAGVADFRIHDLRRSLGSWQTITGASTAVVGKALGHKSVQATAVYSRMHIDPVRESVQKAVDAMQAASKAPIKVRKLRAVNDDEVDS